MPEVTYWLVDLDQDGETRQTVCLGATPDEAFGRCGRFDRVLRMRRISTKTAVEILESETYE